MNKSKFFKENKGSLEFNGYKAVFFCFVKNKIRNFVRALNFAAIFVLKLLFVKAVNLLGSEILNMVPILFCNQII